MFVRALIEGPARREAPLTAPGDATLALQPSAAGSGDEPPQSFHGLEIDPGRNHVALTLGLPETESFVPVRFVVDGHSVPPPTERIDYAALTLEPAGIVRKSVEWSRDTRGELCLTRRELEAILAEARGAGPLYLTGLERERRRARVGFVSGPLDAGMSELVLTEVPAAHAEIRVEHNGSSRFMLSVQALLVEPAAEDTRSIRVAAKGDLGLELCALQLTPGQRLVPMPRGMLPGRWRFSFRVEHAPRMQIAPVEVELTAGGNELAIEMTDLFEVTVHAPSLGEGVRLRLRQPSALVSAAPNKGIRDIVALDANKRAVFGGLPAGHYVLTHGASHAPQNIAVPCGEVLYEPRRSDAFEVHLAPLDGGGQGALARAGFQTGDVLLDFNGRGLREHDDLDALLEVIAENQATERVRRGAHTLELRLGPMPDRGDPWATFDAEFVPAWR